MRISDWSSDVCSSDLTPTGPGRPGNLRKPLPPPHRPFSPPAAAARLGRRAYRRDEIGCLDKRRPTTSLLPSMEDRKSVVSGKSVSVRVDLGGRRIIKKKNNNQIFYGLQI